MFCARRSARKLAWAQLVWRDWLTCRAEETSPVQTEETAPAGPGRSPVIGVVAGAAVAAAVRGHAGREVDLAASQAYDNGVL